MSTGLNFEYGFRSKVAPALNKTNAMRVYFVGDFTGPNSAIENTNTNKIIKIDIDNFDDVMIKLSPSVCLASGHKLIFNELEDFHPDNLFENPIFENLRRLKKELSNSTTAEKATNEILSTYVFQQEESSATSIDEIQSNTSVNEQVESKDDMFERLLGKKQLSPKVAKIDSTPNQANSIEANLNHYLSHILNPLIIKDTKPEHNRLSLFIDTAIEKLMKSILHSKEFQTLESAWRSVRDVVFNEAYDEANQFFFIVNTSREELENAVNGDNAFISNLNSHIKNTDSEVNNILVGNFQFSDTSEDITAINYLASFAETIKCQFVSGADNRLTNASSNSIWQQFCQTPQSKFITLSYPRVLLRLPYGCKNDEIDACKFEEFDKDLSHNNLLWGNSAFFYVRLLIRQYHENGLEKLDPIITELPSLIYTEDGEKKLYPCSEFQLSEQQLIKISNNNIKVFLSYRNKNCIRLYSNETHIVNS